MSSEREAGLLQRAPAFQIVGFGHRNSRRTVVTPLQRQHLLTAAGRCIATARKEVVSVT